MSLLSVILSGATVLVYSYGYLGLFILMTLESTGIPIPSEVVLPLAGLLSARGVFNVYAAFFVVLIAGIVGMAIDYYIAYALERKVVYRHLKTFHIKEENLRALDEWFRINGNFAVFIGRLIPEVRGLISLAAGFAQMPKRDFFIYSIAGTIVWDAVLISFGYYALNSGNAYVALISVAILAIILYAVYKVAMKRGRK